MAGSPPSTVLGPSQVLPYGTTVRRHPPMIINRSAGPAWSRLQSVVVLAAGPDDQALDLITDHLAFCNPDMPIHLSEGIFVGRPSLPEFLDRGKRPGDTAHNGPIITVEHRVRGSCWQRRLASGAILKRDHAKFSGICTVI